MVTKYDVFEFAYVKGGIIQPKEVALAFKKTHTTYHAFYQILLGLERQKLLKKQSKGFQTIRNERADLLFKLIRFCTANGINYNDLLDERLAQWISTVMSKREFSIKGLDMNPRTFGRYVQILSQYGLLIVFKRKPFLGCVPYNTFLRDLLRYFELPALVPKSKNNQYYNEIERELKAFRKGVKTHAKEYLKILEEYELKFVQHSLNLEGNPITLPETVKLLKEHITPREMTLEQVQEVFNYKKATEQMLLDSSTKRPLTREDILLYHKLAMQHRSEIAGKIRSVSVIIKNNPHFKIATVKQIEGKLGSLLQEYNDFIKQKNTFKGILEFSAYFHNQFQHVHPFIDGNSRTTRLITFRLLRSQGIPIMDIPLGLLEEYLGVTKGASQRNDDFLFQTLQKIILYNLKLINDRLQKRSV